MYVIKQLLKHTTDVCIRDAVVYSGAAAAAAVYAFWLGVGS